MKIVTSAVLSAMLLAATPAMADRDFNHHRGHRDHWEHSRHFHHYGPHRTVVVRREVVHHYRTYGRAPVYYRLPARVGIHVVLPNIFIPIR